MFQGGAASHNLHCLRRHMRFGRNSEAFDWALRTSAAAAGFAFCLKLRGLSHQVFHCALCMNLFAWCCTSNSKAFLVVICLKLVDVLPTLASREALMLVTAHESVKLLAWRSLFKMPKPLFNTPGLQWTIRRYNASSEATQGGLAWA